MENLEKQFAGFVTVMLEAETSAAKAQEILQGTAAEDIGLRLLLLVLLVSACFALGGRGLLNALLLTRAIRRDPGLLGRSCKLSCVPVFFGIAVLILLCRLLLFS